MFGKNMLTTRTVSLDSDLEIMTTFAKWKRYHLRNLYSIERPYVKLNLGGKKTSPLEPGAYVIEVSINLAMLNSKIISFMAEVSLTDLLFR